MSLFGSRVILASVKGQFWKSESKSNLKRLSLLKKKKRESSAMRERGKKREKRKERKEKQEEKV